MSVKTIIKVTLGKRLLNKRTRFLVRNKAFYNFQTAKSIAIFFNANFTEEYTVARFLSNYLCERKIKTRCLGFLKPQDVKEAPTTFSGFSFFSEKDFSITGMPQSGTVMEFCTTSFDILIDLHVAENYFIDALVAYSVAKMKIGIKNNDKGYYDFMIDLTGHSVTVERVVEEIKHYLNTITS